MTEESYFNIKHIAEATTRDFVNPKSKSFKGSQLIDWLLKNHNPKNLSREELAKKAQEELANPNQAL